MLRWDEGIEKWPLSWLCPSLVKLYSLEEVSKSPRLGSSHSLGRIEIIEMTT